MERSEELRKKYSQLGLWRGIMWVALFVGGYGIMSISHHQSIGVIAAFAIGFGVAAIASIKATRIRGEIKEMERK